MDGFRCENRACNQVISGNTRIKPDGVFGRPTLVCPSCGNKHLMIKGGPGDSSQWYSAGGVGTKDPGDGTGGSTGDGGG